MVSSTLVHSLAGSCARDALASGRKFTFREAMSSRFTRDIQRFKYTLPIYQSDFPIESIKANIMSTCESLKQQIPQHKYSLSETALVFESCQKHCWAMNLSPSYQTRKFHPPSHDAGGSEPGGPPHT